ncbi:retrovirus-related pol polyprotein from transposon TNT 1-94 [Tanacetum coccineum]
MTEGKKQNKNKSKSWKIGEIKDKEVNMAAGDSDDALVYCVKNTVEDRIMDSSASFHTAKKSKIGSGNTPVSWTLKDLRYFPGLKRRLISVGKPDEEGYNVGFGDQQWKITKGSLVVARGNKRGSLYMVDVHPEEIGAIIDGSGSATLWFGEAEESFLHNISEDKETAEVGAMKDVFGEAMNCTFIGNNSNEMRYSFRDTKSHRVIQSRDIIFVDSIYGARSATDSSSLTKPIQKSDLVLIDISDNLAENDSIVVEHGLSSKIT